MTDLHEHANARAGQGPVVLDIGGDVGAVVITVPARLSGAEIEMRPLRGAAAPPPLRHVGVLPRPVAGGRVHSAVFDAVRGGAYEIYVRPDGPVALSVEVRPGEVTFATWPD
jgi:hypothetical protein